jgi:hypothetical protein
MTDTEIRIAMAELDGWRRTVDSPHWSHDWTAPNGERTTFVPDYPNDLNAVRRVAFKALNFDEQASTDLFRFRCALTKISGNDRDLCVFASAKQVSEAILRVVGKWKESAK